MMFAEDKHYTNCKKKTVANSQYNQHQHTRNTQAKHTLKICQRQQDQQLHITCAKTNEKKKLSKTRHTRICYSKTNKQINITQ